MPPFQKGNTFGKGRPKKEYSLTNHIREIGHIENEETKNSNWRTLAEKVWSDALAGDKTATSMIFDRTEGKPMQSIQVKITRRH